jgi:hypothetical protein
MFVLGLLAGLIWCSPAWAARSNPTFNKVLVVVFENVDVADALRQPGFARLASQGSLLTNFRAEAHPSQPNYLALVSASTQHATSDAPVDVEARTLVDLLEERKKTWKSYLEDFPGHCSTVEKSSGYVRKHNPFISFLGIRNSTERCSHLVPATQLGGDLASGNLPDFSLYVPNVRNDGHDTDPAFASRWLTMSFLPSLGNPLPKGLLVVVTFDESENQSSAQGNRIFTGLLGAGVAPGSRSNLPYDHYSILRTIEDRFDLGRLGANDAKAFSISEVWK